MSTETPRARRPARGGEHAVAQVDRRAQLAGAAQLFARRCCEGDCGEFGAIEDGAVVRERIERGRGEFQAARRRQVITGAGSGTRSEQRQDGEACRSP